LDLHRLTIHEAHDLLRAGELTSVELTEAVLERIAAVDNRVRAYLTLTPEFALERARLADARWAAWRRDGGEPPPALLGIPLAIKDVICLEGVPTTCGSRILENFIPPYSATVVEKLAEQGAVFLGKTNTDEFAMGSSTENSAFFTTHNPWDLDRVPGGSSGGSAAAVAAGAALGAFGSDTGGSVRQPASLCGVAGMKPTYGRISRYGLVAFASSLDQIGPFGRDVTDCALLLRAVAGHDPLDSNTIAAPVPDYVAELPKGVKGLRVGVPREFFVKGMQAGVEQAVRIAIDQLAALGMELRDISLPHTQYGLQTYYLIAPAEASANLARYDGIRYGYSAPEVLDILDGYLRTREQGFGAEVKRRIMLGTYALSAGYYDAYYLKAQKVRTLIKQDFERAFESVDVIVTPTSPSVAFKIGEKTSDPLEMYLSDIFTLTLNLAGLGGLSIPCGFADGLPIGLQIIGPALAEDVILRVGYAYEQVTDWRLRQPSL
jgi:aspartyl-tRNA(Asn)/glutamyl-tRNA(Gln) amidotransferase subunit A